ncbi:8-oxo-dGTP diphosphatase [Bulleidia sp. zg-1006]|uniref:NUDIX hydrolase n=1 Tax=Bulleidia sp. zg-1006 TaxID=2806552 RepID=UPI00193A6FB2|nr:8-oxo-dGTP diphosphatase [Bulleidia sp. zg-1006]QRG87350.1 8-oxo-dGTP diphosphatase [Bulleidia sp. zg-1006]
MRESAVTYLVSKKQILMLLRNKKEKDLNAGKWLGVGGKKEVYETIEECAMREVYEETGYRIRSLKAMGILDFVYPYLDVERIHVFLCQEFDGIEKECLEGELHWIDISKMDALNLWSGDRYFLPKIVENDCPYFHYVMKYDEQDVLVDVKELV